MYAIMIGLSIVLGLGTCAFFLAKKNVPVNIAVYSVFLELVISTYLALMTTYILSGGENYGLTSSGGAAGMLLGAFIMSKITPQYREQLFSSGILSLPLMYGIGKIGCAYAGCCGGIKYEGIFHISSERGNVFPIQTMEAIVFLVIYAVSLLLYLRDRFNPLYAAMSYSFVKIILDFLRQTHESRFVTANQIMCFVIVLVLALTSGIQRKLLYRKSGHYSFGLSKDRKRSCGEKKAQVKVK